MESEMEVGAELFKTFLWVYFYTSEGKLPQVLLQSNELLQQSVRMNHEKIPQLKQQGKMYSSAFA
jgi:hypothetical protein